MVEGLSNAYVENIFKKIIGSSFIGVYPCDIHPIIKLKHFSIIFNTGDSSTKGEHFIAIFTNRNSFFYFDSFGKKNTDKNVQVFIEKHAKKKKMYISKQKIQHDNSSFCGFYCIAFLISKYRKLKNFRESFSKYGLMKNDENVVQFICKNLNK